MSETKSSVQWGHTRGKEKHVYSKIWKGVIMNAAIEDGKNCTIVGEFNEMKDY